MVLTAALIIKFLVVLFITLFHSLQGRYIKGIVLGTLLFLGIPGFDDFLIQPLFSQLIGVSMPLSMVIYFIGIWALIILIWWFI